MKEFKGTPGPWEWECHKGSDSYWLGQPGTERFEAVIDDGSAYGEYGKVIDPNGHNANLIAAAPDLLQALQEMLEKVENILLMEFSVNPSDRDYVVHAREAIARALGEKQ